MLDGSGGHVKTINESQALLLLQITKKRLHGPLFESIVVYHRYRLSEQA